MSRRSTKRRTEAHVRLYRHELTCPAYRSLSCPARALLVEFRALYGGGENRVFLSLREMERRLGVGRKIAEKARDELLDRGFIRLVTKGSFNRKVRHASEYVLTHEPLTNRDGATAPKDFMRWAPDENAVYLRNTDGVPGEHRGHNSGRQKPPHGVPEEHRKPLNHPCHGVPEEHTDKLPGGTDLLLGAFQCSGDTQLALIMSALLLNWPNSFSGTGDCPHLLEVAR